MVQAVLHRVNCNGLISFEPPKNLAIRSVLGKELKKIHTRYNDYAMLNIQPPYPPRTTGEGSQNHHLNGHIMQICNETGNDYNTVKLAVKMIAVQYLNYPFNTVGGVIVPKRERDCNTQECGLLIEAAHMCAAEEGIILREE